MSFFADFVNTRRNGLRVGGKRYAVHFTYVGDSSSTVLVAPAMQYAITAVGADFVTGPFTSGLTGVASAVSFANGRIMMAAAAASTSVISSNNLTFGMLPPTEVWLSSPIAILAENASAIGQLASLRVAFIQDVAYPLTVCSVGADHAAAHGLAVPNRTISTVGVMPTVEEAKAALAPLRAAGINVLVGCMYQAPGEVFVRALQEMNYSLSALMLTSISIPSWEGEYMFRPSPWHPSAAATGVAIWQQ